MTTMQTARKLVLGAVAAAALAMTGAAQADVKATSSALGQFANRAIPISGAAFESNVNALSSQVVDVAGIKSFGEYGAAGNVVLNFFVGANATITTVDWNVNLTANDPSWLSELTVAFGSSAGGDGVVFSPGYGDDDFGTSTYSGSASLVDLGLSFQVGADGILRLEFHEVYNDPSVNPDGVWNSGNLTFGVAAPVPEPSTYGMMALGLLGVAAVARRRKSA
ncbi:PEP-CTERM sorting domain-containing protein [Paucibacter sp. DJ1R-11]|uniref:PEP-CTERM sorting domain-containing protein n=1 Tax=Paucibacter sp. DJ1R-11 TaxID=2893556 RepID=UPI0021E478F0|nr:PEP-CTERM sorting domain-containing protein [Paucibacter sp. DJ1R-11]MCV2363534.1 PEP-CTERM sorting domain-containing protein [Paucibacter sp. DJ1R-11]